MAGNRALHNFRRRQKLLEKYGGSSWDSWGGHGGGKGGGKGYGKDFGKGGKSGKGKGKGYRDRWDDEARPRRGKTFEQYWSLDESGDEDEDRGTRKAKRLQAGASAAKKRSPRSEEDAAAPRAARKLKAKARSTAPGDEVPEEGRRPKAKKRIVKRRQIGAEDAEASRAGPSGGEGPAAASRAAKAKTGSKVAERRRSLLAEAERRAAQEADGDEASPAGPADGSGSDAAPPELARGAPRKLSKAAERRRSLLLGEAQRRAAAGADGRSPDEASPAGSAGDDGDAAPPDASEAPRRKLSKAAERRRSLLLGEAERRAAAEAGGQGPHEGAEDAPPSPAAAPGRKLTRAAARRRAALLAEAGARAAGEPDRGPAAGAGEVAPPAGKPGKKRKSSKAAERRAAEGGPEPARPLKKRRKAVDAEEVQAPAAAESHRKAKRKRLGKWERAALAAAAQDAPTTAATDDASAGEPVKPLSKRAQRREREAKRQEREAKLKALEAARPKLPSAAELRRRRQEERRRVRHRARVVCPGSVTDRFSRAMHFFCTSAPLDADEWRLLWQGGLSWRWHREEFPHWQCPQRSYKLPPVGLRIQGPPRRDHWDHEAAMKSATWELRSSWEREALRRIDERLGEDALFPMSKQRVTLASRLAGKGALHKRCARHLEEVLSPLLEPPVADPGADEGMAEPMLAEARRLLFDCVAKWHAEGEAPGDDAPADEAAATRRAWSQMLRRAMALREEHEYTPAVAAWLRALRCSTLARLCPWHDDEAQQQLLRRVAELAGGEGAGEGPAATRRVVVLPLGVFSCWQALLLVGVSRWLGADATVVRRKAGGGPEVVFRTTDVAAAPPPAENAAATDDVAPFAEQ